MFEYLKLEVLRNREASGVFITYLENEFINGNISEDKLVEILAKLGLPQDYVDLITTACKARRRARTIWLNERLKRRFDP